MTNTAQPKQPKRFDAVRELKDGRDNTMGVQRWDRFLASSEAASGGMFSQALAAHERSTAWAAYARETFAKLYDSGTQRDLKPEDRPLGADWVDKLHESAEALPEWRALKERARRDAWACGVAAGEALNVIASTVKPPETDPQQLQDELDFVRSLMEGEGQKTSPKHLKRMASLQRQIADAKEEHARASQMLGAKGAGLRSAMRKAAINAQQTIDEMDEAMSMLGAGEGAGSISRVNAPPAVLRAALQKNKKLRQILKLAGRMKAAAIQKQRSKATTGREELCDVTSGDDIARLVPSELANLADPTTEALLYRKLMERSAMTYELRGKVSVAEGPIIMCVDESGSMSGARDTWAKAVAFALMEIAARQNRPFAYIHFDSRVSRVDEITNARKVGLKELEEFVSYFTGGGTCIANALGKAAEMLEGKAGEREQSGAKPWKRADVILVSDGDDYDNGGQKAAIDRIRKQHGHLYSIFIEDRPSNDSPLVKMADEKMYITNSDVSGGDPSKLGNMFSM